MIKNIIFDIGNVCVTFDTFSFYMKMFHNEEKTKDLIHKVFANDIWSHFDQGLILADELHDAYIQKFPRDIDDIDNMLNNWKQLMQPIPETPILMKALKEKGYKLYILSNISEDSATYLKKKMEFFKYIDGEVLSYNLKLIKPDARIYNCLLDTYDLQAHECIFVDDLSKNIEQAEMLGIHGILYQNAKQVEEDIYTYIKEQIDVKE